MIVLTKMFSRQHYPLFFVYVWSQSDLHGLQKWLGNTIQNLVMLRESEKNKISVWYSPHDIEKMHQASVQKISDDTHWFDDVESSFYEHWQKLLPYVSGQQELKNVTDIQEYYSLWLSWWPIMAILFEIPNIESLPQDIRDRALKARSQTQDFSDGGEESIDTFFEKYHTDIAPIWRLMTPDEMFRLNQLSDQELTIIQQREHGFALINGDLIISESVEDTLTKLGLKLKQIDIGTNTYEIKGQPACMGYARGKVRLVLGSEDISKLQQGEILVTEMTTPIFVPAMKLSAAIVTDEGGVTCHAAIVSRELNKPCVIGTKIATQALKDGVEVEVNANNGIVRILK